MPSREDHLLARNLAGEAGRRLLALRERANVDDLRKAGDRESHEFLISALTAARPGDAILSEEGKDDPRRLTADRVWIIDPLDGTREYGEPGRTDWAVHVALWERSASVGRSGRPEGQHEGGLTAAAVALPAQGMTLSTADPPQVPPRDRQRPLRVTVSRTRPPRFVNALAAKLGAELVPMGSAGAKVAAVITGTVDAYIHAGGQYEWDSAAPVAVALVAGLHASRIDASDPVYNQSDPLLPDLVVCRCELGELVLANLAAVL
jgi:3'(2'), 5'-bisphosphate nucleotidase